jgi:hypothetical protein
MGFAKSANTVDAVRRAVNGWQVVVLWKAKRGGPPETFGCAGLS